MVPEVAYRIAHLYGSESYNGGLKYFMVLREPVSRAISSWLFKFDGKCFVFFKGGKGGGCLIYGIHVPIVQFTKMVGVVEVEVVVVNSVLV